MISPDMWRKKRSFTNALVTQTDRLSCWIW